MYFSEIAARGVLWKIFTQKKNKNSQQNTCARVFFFDKISNFV